MKASLIKKILFCSILIIFFFFLIKYFARDTQNIALLMHRPYVAVFLSNGQVYFGHIEELDTELLTLTDVYYLRANTNLQSDQTKDQKPTTNVQVALIKLGNELHGPKDTMMINRTSILFWEELREDGKVVQAIERYQP